MRMAFPPRPYSNGLESRRRWKHHGHCPHWRRLHARRDLAVSKHHRSIFGHALATSYCGTRSRPAATCSASGCAVSSPVLGNRCSHAGRRSADNGDAEQMYGRHMAARKGVELAKLRPPPRVRMSIDGVPYRKQATPAKPTFLSRASLCGDDFSGMRPMPSATATLVATTNGACCAADNEAHSSRTRTSGIRMLSTPARQRPVQW